MSAIPEMSAHHPQRWEQQGFNIHDNDLIHACDNNTSYDSMDSTYVQLPVIPSSEYHFHLVIIFGSGQQSLNESI